MINQTLAHGRALPETVTPFVTQGGRPGQITSTVPTSLEVQTPYSMMKPGLKNEEWGKGSPPLSSVLATPATDPGNISSKFKETKLPAHTYLLSLCYHSAVMFDCYD